MAPSSTEPQRGAIEVDIVDGYDTHACPRLRGFPLVRAIEFAATSPIGSGRTCAWLLKWMKGRVHNRTGLAIWQLVLLGL